MASLLSYLGWGKPTPAPVKAPQDPDKDAVRALPGSWYTDENMYQLERRAIFSRRWIMITHTKRFPQTGDSLRYDVANINFTLLRDQDGNINGFRDACDFDETDAGIPIPIHIHIDHNGFIWVNLDGKEVPEVAWDDDFAGVDQQDRYEGLNFDDYEFDHAWEMTGDYNWKILSDNYNECYHCATTHPDLLALTDLHSYCVVPEAGYIKHFVATKPEQEARGLRVHPTYFFPSTSMNISMHFFMLQRFVPHGPVKSSMRYEVYRHKASPDEDFQLVNEMYKRVMSEDKALCELAQKNVNAGTFINGEMHPRLERGPLYIQKLCREAVTEFRQREIAAGQRIWPAKYTIPTTNHQLGMNFLPSVAPSHSTQQEVLAF